MTGPICGCGQRTGITTVIMTDRLWDEFFSVPGAQRPDTATACQTCISDWNRYAGPLTLAPSGFYPNPIPAAPF